MEPADCGPVNPLAGLVKQFADADRSLQRDRIQDGPGPSMGPMRQRPFDARQARDQEMAEEFFRQSQAPLMPGRPGFEMRDMSRELERMAPMGPMGPKEDWAQDFARHQHGPMQHDFKEFEQVFARHAGPQGLQKGPMNWADDFARFDSQFPQQARITELVSPEQEAEFEAAFQRAKALDAGPADAWEKEFVAHEAQSWVEEFAQQEEKLAQEATARGGETDETKAALARTAGLLIQAVSDSANPKFKQSKFMEFMKQLRDGEVAIEGNKVVEQQASWENEFGRAEGGQAWADEFAGDKPAGWAEEFATQKNGGGPGNWAAEFGAKEELARPSFQGGNWADEFSGIREEHQMTDSADWANEFEARMGRKPMDAYDWAEEFQKQGLPQSAEDMDKWLNEFSQEEDEEAKIKEYLEMHEENAKMSDWVSQFRKQLRDMDGMGDEEGNMDWGPDMQADWERFQGNSFGYRATDPRYNNYEFQSNNPFLQNNDVDFLRDVSRHRSLAESILALEAAVQRHPDDARSWFLLGSRQQENEKEASAIAALRRSVDVDPNSLESWIALSVSYTNEGFREDAYDALESWLQYNPRYSDIVRRAREGGPPPPQQARQEDIVSLFLAAARSNPGMDLDADVQQALGILFNASEEYDKAVDCFEAAIARRPNDYMLYNKLGATLANAKQSERAIEAYSAALDINPDYIRARYNLAISCINLGNHHEAAEHLLHALAMQQAGTPGDLKGKGKAFDMPMGGPQSSLMSDSIWDTLRMTMIMMQRPDLASQVDLKDVNAFRTAGFDF